jgi:SAM-dependent methyltransferase
MPDRPDGKTVFDAVAACYDAARPGYPRELIDDIVSLSHLPPAGRLLEIGCGPGKATLPFAERGYAMLCVEPGPQLIARAQARVRAYPQVQFVVSSFEDWPLEAAAFDLVIAASSFHWVDPEVGFPKVAAALKDTGAFALFRNGRHLPDAALEAEIQQAYAAHAPERHSRGDSGHRHDPRPAEIESTGLFREVLTRSHPWRKEFTAEEYVALLDTYSGHRAMPDAQRQTLFSAIAAAIHARGGTITVQYLSTLYLATK